MSYLLLFYVGLGLMIAGALFFNRAHKANPFLAVFVLIFSLEQLDFLYVTSELVRVYPEPYLLLFPSCLLFGPSLWFYLRFYKTDIQFKRLEIVLHLLPFILYTIYTLYLFTYTGAERIAYIQQHFYSQYMPLNYGKAWHVTAYGVLMIRYLYRQRALWNQQELLYLGTLCGLYGITALLQAYLTLFVHDYSFFKIYFLLASSIVMVVAYVMSTGLICWSNGKRNIFGPVWPAKTKNGLLEK